MTCDSPHPDEQRAIDFPSDSSHRNSGAPLCGPSHKRLKSEHKLLSKTTRIILYIVLAPFTCFSGVLLGTFLHQLARGQENEWKSIGPPNTTVTRLAVEKLSSIHQESGSGTTIIYAQTPDRVLVSADAQNWRALAIPLSSDETDWFLLHTQSGVLAIAMTSTESIKFSFGNAPRWSQAEGLSYDRRFFSVENCRSRPGTIYAAAEDKGHSEDKPDQLLKSTDAGETWIPVRGWSEQTNTTSLCDVKVDPLNADVVYLVLDHDGSSTLTKTTNGGLTWRSTAFRDSHFGYLDLTFAPDHSRTLYVLSTARGVASLYKSFDGLKSVVLKWRFSDAYALAIDPKDDKHLFVLAHLHQLYESRDGGETWDTLDTSVLGKNVALSLAVDATGNIYLGTARNGIFMHGPWQHRIQISRSPALAPARTTKPGTKATNSTTNHRTAVPVSFLAGRQR